MGSQNYDIVRMKQRDDINTAYSGWYKIVGYGMLGLLVLLFCLQMAFGIPIFDRATGSGGSGTSTIILAGVFIFVIYLIYTLFVTDCNYEFACLLHGGRVGQKRQNVREQRRAFLKRQEQYDREYAGLL